ncbi:MAG TPA: hypothetical protein VK447_13840, partial [Myxococcaceae bacterium]|nr:hypothetical protein [Myxococcaceae bacterium]
MAKAPRPWTVLPYDPIEKLEDNLWAVNGTLPRGSMKRRMAIVKRTDGKLVFHNAIPLSEPDMKAVEAWGEPGYLIVSNGFHRLDIHAFKQRYPNMKVLCPEPHDARVREIVQVDGHYDAFPPDPAVEAQVLEGSKIGEAVFIVSSGPRKTLLFADTLMNIPDGPGMGMFIMKLLGSVGDLRVTRIGRMLAVKDPKAIRRHLERLAGLPGLSRIVLTHGDDVTADVPAALRKAAARL